MYAFINGIIEEKTTNSVIIENNGIGYEIFVSNSTLSNLANVGELAKVYTYLYVRDDIQQLFGFLNKEEKDVFLQLITISGIGAKMALVILSSFSVKDLIGHIATGDAKALSQAKGVGKKTAERIILELKNKIGELSNTQISSILNTNTTSNTATDEACELLVNMGIGKFEAIKIINRVAIEGDTTEQIIQKALKNLN